VLLFRQCLQLSQEFQLAITIVFSSVPYFPLNNNVSIYNITKHNVIQGNPVEIKMCFGSDPCYYMDGEHLISIYCTWTEVRRRVSVLSWAVSRSLLI